MDPTTAVVTVICAVLIAIPATISAWASLKTHGQVTRNGHKDPEKPTLPDRVTTVDKKVSELGDHLVEKVDMLVGKVDQIAETQESQGAQIKALWRLTRR